MGYNSYTTTDLINNIKLITHMPLGNNTFNPSDIITLADRELQTALMKQIISTRGGFYLTYEDQAANSTGLYPIPEDAISAILSNVEVVVNENIIQVNPVEESEQFSTTMPTSLGYGYFIRGNDVQILPVPITGTVRLWYYRRPSKLVSVSSACEITDINGSVISVASIPSTITQNDEVDAVGSQPTFNVLGTRTITNINGTDITLSGVVDNLEVGDYLCLNNQTCVPQIPVEFRPLLEQRVAVKVYELQGYLDKMKAAEMKLQQLEATMTSLISNRVKSKTKVVTQSTGGLLNPIGGRFKFPASRNG